MSRMDRMLNSKKDKQTIYEIYRACRLCGAGAGYKMPIIQNVVDLDDTDIELKQKIRECVQIEVHQDDKMPPLICELCVDKVNDFYEFLEMCRQTNKRTRLRLGLPPQSLPGGAPDAGDCILGLTEPVYVNEDSDGEPLSKHKKPNQHKSSVKIKKEPQVKVEPRSSRQSKREPTPPRTLRNSRNSREDSSQRSQERSSKSSPKVSPKATPKSILKKTEDTSLLSSRLKRARDKDPVKIETPVKKVKIAVKPVSPPSKPKPKRKPSPPRTYKCDVCSSCSKTPQALAQHVRTHAVTYTNVRLACNPCGEWFSTAEQAASHHRQHRGKANPYHCRRCQQTYKKLADYDEHIANACEPWPEVPDVKCESCWHLFATNNLLDSHRCLGQDHRPGGKCSKCNRSYALLKNLKKHESTCTAKKKGTIDPALLAKVKPLQVRVSRCDPLLLNVKQEHYDVSSVAADFGLDKSCVYPYISSPNLRIKSELPTFKGMVSINEEIKHEFCAKEYVHWDSEDSDSDISLLPLNKEVESLSILSLKTLFSRKCLGRVPRKKRRVKVENFDSILDTEDDVTRDINNIIDNLDNDDDLDDLDIDRNDVNDSILSKDGDESKLSNDIDENDESSKINSLDNDKSLDNTINSNDKIGDEDNSKNDDDNSKNTENESSNKNDEIQSDGILNSDEGKVNDKESECENNNDNNLNVKIDDNSKDCKDINSDDSLNTKDTSDDHDINESLKTNDQNENHQISDENNDDHANNDENSREQQISDEKHQEIDEKSENHQIGDENSGNHQKDDESSINHQEIDENGENNQKDDENSGNHQIGDENSENHQTNDKNSIDHKNNDDNTNDQNDDVKENKVKHDENDAQSENQINDITNDLQNNDFSKDLDDNDLKNNLDGTDSISKDKTNDSQGNVDDNDLVSKVDINDCQDHDEVKEISEEQVTDSINNQNDLLSELNSQESNSVTFNDDQLNDERKNECVNEEDKTKMAVNEDFSVEPISANNEHENINGDSDYKTLDNNKLKNDEIEDSKLMAALDAQIGESDSVVPEKPESYGFNDKIALEDLITDKSTEKPIEMDLLNEEFNFDN